MTDRKTAAELRATAEAATGYDRMVLLHLAAAEEEREAEDAGDEELAREVTGRASHELRRELDAMTRIADEQRERAKSAERQLQECDHKLIEAEGCRDDWASRYGQAAQQLADMTRSRDDWKARHDSLDVQAACKIDELRAALKDADRFGHAMAALANERGRLAVDALRIGLEECERLRAERDRWIDVAVAYEDRIAALTGDREKVGEWWEVRAASGLLLMGKLSRPAAFGMKYAADRLVHVTRWRKR